MWCPTSLIVNDKETEFPVPEPCMPVNFINSTGMRYEAEEVRQRLLKGIQNNFTFDVTITKPFPSWCISCIFIV